MAPRTPCAARVAATALVCALATGLTACSGDDPAAPSGEPTSGPTSATPAETAQIETTTTISRVEGRLDDRARARLRVRVTAAVDAWIDGAYGGDYPRDDFAGAFDTFTKGAVARARADSALMTNEAVGLMVEEVRALRRRVKIDVLGVDGVAVAVTAHVELDLALSGEITRTDAISGSLFLTFNPPGARSDDGPGWRVFGYDLAREEV